MWVAGIGFTQRAGGAAGAADGTRIFMIVMIKYERVASACPYPIY